MMMMTFVHFLVLHLFIIHIPDLNVVLDVCRCIKITIRNEKNTLQTVKLQQPFYLRHLLRQHISQDVNGVSFGFGGRSCSQQQLQEGNLTQVTTKHYISPVCLHNYLGTIR